jgi:hypothetical protein
VEEWIRGGFSRTPEELVAYIRMCNAIHGKWEYQLAMKQEPDIFSLEKYRQKEW